MSKLEHKENLEKYSRLSECPVRNVMSRFSGKWSVLVLCVLGENELTRFNAIAKAIPDISPKVLTETLKNLENDKLIQRMVYAEVPPRVEYSLTKLGQSLMPLLGALIEWSLEHFEEISSNTKK
ncbi:MAG: helix-turn-helix transcriptional regulator [Muribaculaceae bacterium]|nr:helix-turn-helix transcriptional regulator [Muribaculaceae bacterium]MDE6702285.1 helix-turn-helix transcriptional regulator [Muribaculaceae bacterium]